MLYTRLKASIGLNNERMTKGETMNTAENSGLNADLGNEDETDLDTDLLPGEGEEGDDDGELVITLGDEPSPGSNDGDEQEEAEAPKWVKELRKTNRELARKLKEAETRASAQQQPQQEPEAPVLGERPTLEGSNYDEDEFNTALEKWFDDKQKVADYQKAQQRKLDDAKAGQQKVMDDYSVAAKKLKVPDFKAAESTVIEFLSADQQGLILNGADDPAKLVYVLGRNPEKLKTIASITNPVKFAFAVSKLEGEIKVSKRDKPAPESGRVHNSAGTVRNNGTDKTLERLEAEADKTGDRTKVQQYMRSLKGKQ